MYAPVSSYDSLKKVLEEKLAEYNETNAVMDLELFQQALEHITRISRIIDQPRWAVRGMLAVRRWLPVLAVLRWCCRRMWCRAWPG